MMAGLGRVEGVETYMQFLMPDSKAYGLDVAAAW
jgi:hypothetical protein